MWKTYWYKLKSRLPRIIPANIRLDEGVLKTSFVFVFRRRLQDVLIKTNMFALALRLQGVFKTSWSRPLYSSWPYVFKTSSIRLAKTSSRRFEDVFKTSSKRLQDLFKAPSRHLQHVLQRYLQNVFKTSSRPLQGAFKTSSTRLAKISSRRFQGVPSS